LKSHTISTASDQLLGGNFKVGRDVLFMTFMFASILMTLAYIQMNTTLPVFLRDVHGIPDQGYGYLLILFITQKSYRKGEKWSWYALLKAGVITWGSLIGYRVAIGYVESVGIATPILGLALLFIGLALPARAILGK